MISPNVLFASINRFNALALVVLRTQTLNTAPPLMADPMICTAGNEALVNRLSKRMLPSSLPLTLLVPLTPPTVELVRANPVTFVPRMPKLVKSFNCIHDNETPAVLFRKIPGALSRAAVPARFVLNRPAGLRPIAGAPLPSVSRRSIRCCRE